MASSLLQAMEPSPTTAGPEARSRVTAAGLRRVLDTAATRVSLYAADEPPLLHSLMQTLETAVPRLAREVPVVNNTDPVPVPGGLDRTRLDNFAKRVATAAGVPVPALGASASPSAVVYLQEPSPVLRIGAGLWSQGDESSVEGLIALGIARAALRGARARALSPMALDLLLAAAFEAVEVFNPMTADSDRARLLELTTHLRKALPPRQREALERQCQGLANHAFDATARALLATDLHYAALLCGSAAPVLAGACLLDGAGSGGLKQRINRSRAAQDVVAHVLTDEFLAAQTIASRDE